MQHPFAVAGFAAPYVFIGAHVKQYQACSDAPTQAAGTCDVCGTCYKYGADFRDANGKEFATGLICAAKSLLDYGDPELAAEIKAAHKALMAEIREQRYAEQRAERAAARQAEQDARYAEEVETCRVAFDDEVQRKLAAVGHPLSWRREKGDSWADAVRWYVAAGHFRRALACLQDGMDAIESGTAPALIVIPQLCTREAATHLGSVGERVTITGKLKAEFAFETIYGRSFLFKIATADGQLVGVRTSSPNAFYREDGTAIGIGDELTLTGSVKAHETDRYEDNRPVTWLQRCKLGAPKAKAARKARKHKV